MKTIIKYNTIKKYITDLIDDLKIVITRQIWWRKYYYIRRLPDTFPRCKHCHAGLGNNKRTPICSNTNYRVCPCKFNECLVRKK
jgi:hypothetical protein